MGRIIGIHLTSNMSITHILFVDDVVLFGHGTYEEWINFRHVIDLFTTASGMAISMEKYYFLINNVSNDVMEQVKVHSPP